MRIIGGKYRGKKLFSPESANVRPTSDRAREALFNILRSKLGSFDGRKLIDVFCGTGAFALEALSQGFAKVAAVDVDVRAVRKNAALFVAEKANIQIINCDAARLSGVPEYDVLFMDAPYNKGLSEPALRAAASVLKPNALCLIEVQKDEQLKLPEHYEMLQERCYGLAKVVIARFAGAKS